MPSNLRPMIPYKCTIVTTAISLGNPVFQQMTMIWPFKVTKVKLIMPSYSRPMTLYLCSMVTIVLSLTETLFFSRWHWSDLPRSPKVKRIMPSDPRQMTSYECSIVTIALSRRGTLFLSRSDLDLTFQGHQWSNWLCHPIRGLWLLICIL